LCLPLEPTSLSSFQTCLALALPLPCPCLALALLTGFRLFRLSRLQAGQAKEEGERAKEKKTARVKKRFDILKEQSKMAVLTSASDERKA